MGFASWRRTQADRKGAERKLVRVSFSCKVYPNCLFPLLVEHSALQQQIHGSVCLTLGPLVHTVAHARPFCGCSSKAKAHESLTSRLQRIARWAGGLQSHRHRGRGTKATRARLRSIQVQLIFGSSFCLSSFEHNSRCALLCDFFK